MLFRFPFPARGSCQFRRLSLTTGLLALTMAWSALAGYKSLKLKVEPAPTYPFHQRQGPVTIAADPYQTKEKILTAFDVKNLDKLGLIPILIIVTNDGDDPVLLSGSDVVLIDPKNQSIGQIPVDEVVQAILGQGKGTPKTGRMPLPFPIPKRGGHNDDAFELETDFVNKSLKETRVPPKSTVSGFAFFQLRDNHKSLEGYKIYVPEIRDLKTQEHLLFFEVEIK
jgi:hypothetical protein